MTLFFLDFFTIIFDIVGMKRIALLYIIIGITGITLFGCGEAETVMPDDEILYNNNTPLGTVTVVRAFVDNTTLAMGPTIRIDFSRDLSTNIPGLVYSESIEYDVTIKVYVNGVQKFLGGPGGYIATPTTAGLTESPTLSAIFIDLDNIPEVHVPPPPYPMVTIKLSPDIRYGGEHDPSTIWLSDPYEFGVSVH